MRHTPVTTSRAAVLRAIPLFRACTDRQLSQVEVLVDDIEVEAGEILIREGNYEPQSFIIISGEATVSRSGSVVATLTSGDFLGEMAVLAPGTRSATVTATTAMHLLVIDPRNFMSLLGIADVARVMLRGLVERLRRADAAVA